MGTAQPNRLQSLGMEIVEQLHRLGHRKADAGTPMRLMRTAFGDDFSTVTDLAAIAYLERFLATCKERAAELTAPGHAKRMCYGMATEIAVKEVIAANGEPETYDTPFLSALLNQLEADGHRVDNLRDELTRVNSIIFGAREGFHVQQGGRGSGRVVGHGDD